MNEDTLYITSNENMEIYKMTNNELKKITTLKTPEIAPYKGVGRIETLALIKDNKILVMGT
jgi:hypothetical protein